MVTGIVEKQKENTVVCPHKEDIDSHGRGVCKLCGQVRQYDLEFPTRPPVIVKRGRINGFLTEVVPKLSTKPEAVPEPPIEPNLPKEAAQCVPENWGTLSKRQKGDWLEKHRKPITTDLVTIGGSATIKKWRLPLSMIYTLAKRWGVHPARPGRGIAPVSQREVGQPTGGVTLKHNVAPANWDKKTKKQKTNWLKAHRKPLTADLKAIGLNATAKKWHLPQGTVGGLAKRWELFVARPERPAMLPATKNPYAPDPLPSFPAFNEEWTEKMKMAWLRAYTSCRVAETEK